MGRLLLLLFLTAAACVVAAAGAQAPPVRVDYAGDGVTFARACAARVTVFRSGRPILRRASVGCAVSIRGAQLGRWGRFAYRVDVRGTSAARGSFVRAAQPPALFPLSPIPPDAVALVAGTAIPRSQLDALVRRARRGYAQERRRFPQPGSRAYVPLQNAFVADLVRAAELDWAARRVGLHVTDAQVRRRVRHFIKTELGGSRKVFEKTLRSNAISELEVRELFRRQLVSEALYRRVTSRVRVTVAEEKRRYRNDAARYRQPTSRRVRHILVRTRALADRLYRRLQAGASFAQLARRYSLDPGTRAEGGVLTILRGQTVAPFDRIAFSLPTGTLSHPVRTQYGWHLIQAIAPVKPPTTTPFVRVRRTIRQELLQRKRSAAIALWTQSLQRELRPTIAYAAGFAPRY